MARKAARLQQSARPAQSLAAASDCRALYLGVAAALFAVGVVLWSLPLQADAGGRQQLILTAIALLICATPATRRSVVRLLEHIRQPTPRNSWLAAGAIALFSGVYLFATNWWQGSELVPKVVDEPSYLIQIRMLARGRLWMDPHPPEIRPFFDTFNLLVDPKYGSMYFPGTALLYLPTGLFDLPFWLLPLLVSAACVGLLFRLVTELIDGAFAAAAVVMLLGLTEFRGLSVMLFSQTPMLFFGLLMMLAYLRWRRQMRWRWAAAIGAIAGWAGITRPADALCYAVPIGVGMLLDLLAARRAPSSADAQQPSSASSISTTLAALVLASAPFLSLQLIQNIGMTGHWWEFPEARYADESYPAPMLGFHSYDPAMLQRPMLPQKRALNERMVVSLYDEHRPSQIIPTWWHTRLPWTLRFSLPHPLFSILLPLGVLALTDRRRRVLAAMLPCFIGFYIFYVFYIPHYMIVIAPVMIVIALLGFRAAGEVVGRLVPKIASFAATLAVVLPALLSLGSFPEFDPRIHDEDIFGAEFFHDESPQVQAQLDALSAELGPVGKALVLFRFSPDVNVTEEPVYNADVAWPDDAKIIRAQDRGDANKLLYRYYAETRHEPDRQVYRYDRVTRTLKRLGTVGGLVGDGGR